MFTASHKTGMESMKKNEKNMLTLLGWWSMLFGNEREPTMKYIHAKGVGYIIFQENQEHARFARRLSIEESDVYSAGFCSIAHGQISCYGKSESLGKTAAATDAKRMTVWFKAPEVAE